MRTFHCVAGPVAFAGALFVSSAAHAANIRLDDGTPDQLTFTHQDFDYDGGSTNGSPLTGAASKTVAGEGASFTGTWIVNTTQDGTGIIYIVDPGQPNLIRAVITGAWSAVFTNSVALINISVVSSPFGGDLGTLPPAFVGKGVPMPDGSIEISSLFRETSFGSLVPIPSNLTIQYVGDLVPECPEPVLLSQPPNQDSANRSDSGSGGASRVEQADDVTFSQDVVVRSIRWWGLYAFGNTAQTGADMFTLGVYEDAGGLPAQNPVATFHLSNAVRAGTGQLVGGFLHEFVYAANLPAPLTLKANTRYWLAIVNDTTADTDDDWYWSSSGVGNNARAERTPPFTGGWFATGVDRAVELCGNAMSLDCPTDFDSNGLTDGADLAVLLANWGPCGPPLPLVVPTEPARIDMLMNPADDPSAATGTQR